jgi:hypothetical protein
VNQRQRAHLTVRLLLSVVLTVSGLYVFVYLYRWQWNRALISGVFFLASEMGLATLTILRRLRALEERVADQAAENDTAPSPEVANGPRPVANGRGPRLPWLDVGSAPMAVFVPVLMGVGVVLSALAYVVDRTAAATTGRRAAPVGPLTLPPGGLVDGPPAALPAASEPPGRRMNPGRIVVFVLLATLGVAGIDVLADATQTRPDATLPGSTTVIELEIHHNRDRPVMQSASALWGIGSMVIPRNTDLLSLVAVAPDRVRLVLSPALGTHARQRFVGAVEDAVIDNVVARVVSVRSTAPG